MKEKKVLLADADLIQGMAASCVLMRTRLIARAISSIHDKLLQPYGLNSAQLALLMVMYQKGPSTRAEIGRHHHQDRSTLTRNLRVMMGRGWVGEDVTSVKGRTRPIGVTASGIDIILRAKPAWEVGQREAKAILGIAGTKSVMDVAGCLLQSTSTRRKSPIE
jgi:DNA-binding MarR family transcriptional regulator